MVGKLFSIDGQTRNFFQIKYAAELYWQLNFLWEFDVLW